MTYGKMHASTFTGSMVGAGPTVFAVWGYVIANGFGGQVDLNSKLLATVLGTTPEDVRSAIAFLCSPDPESRNAERDGRRLVHLSGVAYEIVNHAAYAGMVSAEDRREYNRVKKREERARRSVPPASMTVNDKSNDPSISTSGSSSDDPEGVQGEVTETAAFVDVPIYDQRKLHKDFPSHWQPSPELVEEAARHGLKREVLELRVRGLRNRPLPGKGVYDIDEYVRGLLPEWSTWGDPKVKRTSSRPPPALLEPSDAHRRFAAKHDIDVDAIVADLVRRNTVEALGLGRARELIGSELTKAARKARGSPSAAA